MKESNIIKQYKMKNLLQGLIQMVLLYLCISPITAQLTAVNNPISGNKNVKFTGGIGIGTQLYKAYGIDNRNVSPMWNIHGNAAITIKGKFTMPFSFTVGRQGSSGTYPTFKQLGISPGYKWAKVHLGYRNMKMSDYTLSGRTFYGVGIELNPGILRLSAMKGRLNKALDYEVNENPTVNSHIFQRSIYAVKVGLGTDKNFLDIIYVKGKDDPESIDLYRSDSLPNPAENAILGLNGKMSITSHVKLYAEFASSIFTRDITSNLSESDYSALTENTIEPRLSTRANYAMKGGIEFIGSGWRTTFQYEKVMPEYSSMGAYYFREDSERFTFGPSFTLFSNKFRFNGSIGIQRNNLLDIKAQTTKNILARGNVSYQANKTFGINLNFSSFNLRQEDGIITLNDTIRIAQVNSNYNLSPYWVWVIDNSQVRTFNVSANYQNLNDKNPFTREFTDMSTWFFNAMFSQTYTPTNFSWNIGSNYNIIQLSNLSTRRYGVTLGVNKSDKENRWSTNLSSSFNLSSIDGESDGSLISTNVGFSYSPKENQSFSLNSNIVRNNSQKFDDYTEIIFNISYQYSFK